MFTNFSPRQGRLFLLAAAATAGSLYGCSKREVQDLQPATTKSTGAGQVQNGDTTGTAKWNRFVSLVEAGKLVDPDGQYVSKSTHVDPDGKTPRLTRPKQNATSRSLRTLFSPDPVNNLYPQPTEPIEDGGGGGGGGGYTPPATNFISTEMVQPWNNGSPVAGPTKGNGYTSQATNAFYTTENPNGYVFDLKIVKAAGSPFNNNPYYHNITIDLNEGAGGDYIYLSFTRDPSHVEYQRFGGCGDEQPKANAGPAAPYLDRPITNVDTEVHCCYGYQYSSCYDLNGYHYNPLYAKRNGPPVNSDYMTVMDLNDGAGGSYVYGYQSRTQVAGRTGVEVGVLTGNVDYIQPPAGWTRVGSDLNNGAGGKYIYFCIKPR